MVVRITCPDCDNAMRVSDDLRGKKVRCKQCEAAVRVPAEDDDEAPIERAVQAKVKLKVKPAADPEADEENERPAKKKKKKKKAAGGSAVLIVVIALVAMLLLGGGGAAAYFFLWKEPTTAVRQDQAKADDDAQKPRIFNQREEGSPTKKGGTGVDQSIRGGVWRHERRTELANIKKMHEAWALDAGPKTLDSYLAYIQRDFGPVHKAIKDGYYRVNVKAKPGSSEILAGERDKDLQGHLVVRASGAIEYVPETEWKAAMGIP